MSDCRRLGICCTDRAGGRCEHLYGTVGVENGTFCSIYLQRWHGMPVQVMLPDGSSYPWRCHPELFPEDCCGRKEVPERPQG